MITLSNINFKYPSTSSNSLKDISLHIKKGECVLLCGHSGCGKTTLTRLINGLIPHFYEGELTGEVTVNHVDILNTELYELASKVGSVFQNPRSQFFCVDSTGEVAFGCENLGLPKTEIVNRIDSISLEMNMTELLGRNIFCLSGGEKQKIACASVAAMAPEVWVLDEPTSNLDIRAIFDLKKTLQRWKSQGKTIIIAEHRLYWLTDLCDRVVYMKAGKIDFDFSMAAFNQLSAEQVDQLGLRTRCLSQINFYKKQNSNYTFMQLENFKYIGKGSKVPRLNIDKLKLPQNSIIAIIGDNGAGKSTFTRCLCGLENRFKGLCKWDGSIDSSRQLLKKSYLVLQDVNHQLFCETVYEELCLGQEVQNKELQSQIIDQLNLKPLLDRHPMSLSGGQKQRVTIATALLASKPLLIFDEPTSGLDYLHMERTAKLINTCTNTSTTLIVTHDPELIIRCCDYVLHLDKGTVVSQYTLDQSGLKKLLDYFRL